MADLCHNDSDAVNLSSIIPFALLLLLPVLSFSQPDIDAAYAVLQPFESKTSAAENAAPRPSGLDGRVMAGYQGWFRTPGDGSGLGFQHYRKGRSFQPGSCTIDLWPDLTEFTAEEKFATPFRHKDGRVAEVFSSIHPKTVDRHFNWMKTYSIDGAFVQRFGVIACGPKEYKQLKADNQKLIHCRTAANQHQRCYALMYDLSGLRDGDFEELARDWKELRTRMQLGTDPNDRAYLQLNGKPLVAIWGVGFDDDRDYSLAFCERFIRLLKHNPDWGGMSIMLGVPYGWRKQDRDAITDERLHTVLELADVISPWAVGRVRREHLDNGEARRQQLADRAWCDQRKISYLPVVYPGFSWHNLKGEKLGAIPRERGRFLQDQFATVKAADGNAAYVAMFDEIDEATAVFKCTNDPPVGASTFLTYDGLPSDHYLRLCEKGRILLRTPSE